MVSSAKRLVKDSVKRMLLKEYIKEQTERAGFGGVTIQRTPMGTQVSVIAEKPGLVIGHRGEAIRKLQNSLSTKFGIDNPQIDIKEAGRGANLNPQIMARKLADALERGWQFRRASHSTVQRIMESGAKGCEVMIAGKIRGDRHKTAKFFAGNIKFCGEPVNQWMHEGYCQAKLKAGVIGVTIRIMDPKAVMPDAVKIKEPQPAAVAAAEAKPAEKKEDATAEKK
ncbi:MAG: 30S ribosomal protein S3 [Thermoplasmata archaeon HGW-Thermoplasmata-2]|nr:MAG: 30S ribosomal protein S3 [Thermoplasmata archaeon HGW-Thermoplasmata-2]